MKQIDIARMNKMQREEALNEAKILSSLSSPYIVGYHESFIENEKLCIIMEYCENGDLSQVLKNRHGKFMEENVIWKYFIEICIALEYLHSKKILHRDIKTMNVFLSKGYHVKLGDLGVAKILSQTTNFAHTMVGTPYYLSPELCQEKPYNEKSDIWSLGCVLYELCCFKHPFEARIQAALMMKIIQGRYDPIPSHFSREIAEIITNCLQKDYKKRPTVSQIMTMSSFQRRARELKIELVTNPEKIIVSDSKNDKEKPTENNVAAPILAPQVVPAPVILKKPSSEKDLLIVNKKQIVGKKPLFYKRNAVGNNLKQIPAIQPAFQPMVPPPLAQRAKTPAANININPEFRPKHPKNGIPHSKNKNIAKKPPRKPQPTNNLNDHKKDIPHPEYNRKPEIIEAEKNEVAKLPDVVGIKMSPHEKSPIKSPSNTNDTNNPDQFMRKILGEDYSIMIKGESEKKPIIPIKVEESVHMNSFLAGPKKEEKKEAEKVNVKEEKKTAIYSAIEDDKNLFTVIEEKVEKEYETINKNNENEDFDVQNDSVDSDNEVYSEGDSPEKQRVSELVNVKENEDRNSGSPYNKPMNRYNNDEEEKVILNGENKDPDIEEDDNEKITNKKIEYMELLGNYEKHRKEVEKKIPKDVVEKFCNMVKDNVQLVF